VSFFFLDITIIDLSSSTIRRCGRCLLVTSSTSVNESEYCCDYFYLKKKNFIFLFHFFLVITNIDFPLPTNDGVDGAGTSTLVPVVPLHDGPLDDYTVLLLDLINESLRCGDGGRASTLTDKSLRLKNSST
jgi:hypothetical protein